MSRLSVTTIETANGSTDLTIKTGNNSGPQITMYANGSVQFPYVSQLNVGSLSVSNTIGSNAQVLTSNGSATYWATSDSFDGAGQLGLLTNPFFDISQEHGITAIVLSTGGYPADQWQVSEGAATLVGSSQLVADPHSGVADFRRLRYGIRTTITTPQGTLGAGEGYTPCQQSIEGSFWRGLGWGTADARPVTIVAVVTASVSGTYGVSLRNGALNRSYISSVSLTANIPTVILVTMPGDTSGTWASDTSVAAYFSIGGVTGTTFNISSLDTWTAGNFAGHSSLTNWGATNGATVTVSYANIFPAGVLPYTSASQITGEALQRLINNRRAPDDELRRCQRYYYAGKHNHYWETPAGGSYQGMPVRFSPTMRVAPSWTSKDVSLINVASFVVDGIEATGARALALSTVNGGVSWNGTLIFNARM